MFETVNIFEAIGFLVMVIVALYTTFVSIMLVYLTGISTHTDWADRIFILVMFIISGALWYKVISSVHISI